MLPDAPLSDILKLRDTFARVASGERLGTASSRAVKSQIFPVLFKLMVKFIIEDEDHNREGNILLVSAGQQHCTPENEGACTVTVPIVGVFAHECVLCVFFK